MNGFYRKTLSQGFRNFFYRKKAQGVVADESPFFIAKFFSENSVRFFREVFAKMTIANAFVLRKIAGFVISFF